MDGSQFRTYSDAGARGAWWLRRIHPVDGMVLLLAVATATFGAMLMVHFAPSLHGGV